MKHIIVGHRRSGKTTRMIELALIKNYKKILIITPHIDLSKQIAGKIKEVRNQADITVCSSQNYAYNTYGHNFDLILCELVDDFIFDNISRVFYGTQDIIRTINIDDDCEVEVVRR